VTIATVSFSVTAAVQLTALAATFHNGRITGDSPRVSSRSRRRCRSPAGQRSDRSPSRRWQPDGPAHGRARPSRRGTTHRRPERRPHLTGAGRPASSEPAQSKMDGLGEGSRWRRRRTGPTSSRRTTPVRGRTGTSPARSTGRRRSRTLAQPKSDRRAGRERSPLCSNSRDASISKPRLRPRLARNARLMIGRVPRSARTRRSLAAPAHTVGHQRAAVRRWTERRTASPSGGPGAAGPSTLCALAPAANSHRWAYMPIQTMRRPS
jgi:hypothetical protein